MTENTFHNDQQNTQPQQTPKQITQQKKPGAKPTKEGRKPPIQAKHKPIRSKHKPIQAKHKPIQRNARRNSNSQALGNQNIEQIKANVTQLTGTNVMDAQVNLNSSKPAQLQAEGIAQGKQVDLAPGKEHHLGHELTHVAQQKQGRVQANVQANNGVGINNDPKLEKEADDVGNKAHTMSPVQMKSPQSSSVEGTTAQNAPMQLKPVKGVVANPKGTNIYKSNIKSLEGQHSVKKGIHKLKRSVTKKSLNLKNLFKDQHKKKSSVNILEELEKMDQYKVKNNQKGIKEQLEYFTEIEIDMDKIDATGKYVYVKAKIIKLDEDNVEEEVTVTGFAPIEDVTEWISQEDFNKKQIGGKANLGVEVEFRNLVLYLPGTSKNENADEEAKVKWDNFGAPVAITKGGKDGALVTDQHSGGKAVVEWNSAHPSLKDSKNGGDFQTKVNLVNKLLSTQASGKLGDLINKINKIMDVGSLANNLITSIPSKNNPKQKEKIEYALANIEYTTNKNQIQTQINMEVPFTKLGLDPEKQGQNNDMSKLFSGSGSDQAKLTFTKARGVANEIATEMIQKVYKQEQKKHQKIHQELASLFTIHLHNAIYQGMDAGKDAHHVLFKTGVGDLVRSVLSKKSKQVLWECIHNIKGDYFIKKLAKQSKLIYQNVYKGRGGAKMLDEIYKTTCIIGLNAFKVEDVINEDNFEDFALKILLLKKDRWGNESKSEAYSSNINDTKNTRKLTGAATGKYFETSKHKSLDKKEKAHYLIAEIRRKGNDINKLVKKKGITPEERKELAKLIEELQTPN